MGRQITPEEVKEAVLASGETTFLHHECGVCGGPVLYIIQDDDVYFDGSCCSGGGTLQYRGWSSISTWINMQTNEDAKSRLMEKFFIKE